MIFGGGFIFLFVLWVFCILVLILVEVFFILFLFLIVFNINVLLKDFFYNLELVLFLFLLKFLELLVDKLFKRLERFVWVWVLIDLEMFVKVEVCLLFLFKLFVIIFWYELLFIFWFFKSEFWFVCLMCVFMIDVNCWLGFIFIGFIDELVFLLMIICLLFLVFMFIFWLLLYWLLFLLRIECCLRWFVIFLRGLVRFLMLLFNDFWEDFVLFFSLMCLIIRVFFKFWWVFFREVNLVLEFLVWREFVIWLLFRFFDIELDMICGFIGRLMDSFILVFFIVFVEVIEL